MPNTPLTATPAPPSQSPAVIEINGYALREIRTRTAEALSPAKLAEQIGVDRSYIAKLELGHNTRVSPQVYARLLAALAITDRRALLANPHGVGVLDGVA